jgi:hypothetical protein
MLVLVLQVSGPVVLVLVLVVLVLSSLRWAVAGGCCWLDSYGLGGHDRVVVVVVLVVIVTGGGRRDRRGGGGGGRSDGWS